MNINFKLEDSLEYDMSQKIHYHITRKIWNVVHDYVYGDVIDAIDFGINFGEFHTVNTSVINQLSTYDSY